MRKYLRIKRDGVVPTVETNTGKIIRRLKQEGWELERHGSDHDVYKHPSIRGVMVVPRHRTLSPGVARMIAKTAGWL